MPRPKTKTFPPQSVMAQTLPFQIIIDNREQTPWFFDRIGHPAFPGLQFQYGTLPTGDYSITGMSDPSQLNSIIIERKSLSDLFGTLGRGRKRFESELSRMTAFDHAALVIEGDLFSIINNPPEMSQMNPKSVFRSLIAICQRYRVAVWPCPGREFAERTAYLILHRYWMDRATSRGKFFIPDPIEPSEPSEPKVLSPQKRQPKNKADSQ